MTIIQVDHLIYPPKEQKELIVELESKVYPTPIQLISATPGLMLS